MRDGASNTTRSGVQSQFFSTDTVAPHERRAFWTEAVCDAIAEVDLACQEDEGFYGRVRWRGAELGPDLVTFTEIASTAQTGRRGPRQVARETHAFIGVTLQRAGTATIEQFGRTDTLRAGDVWLLDGTNVSNIVFDGPFEQLLLKIPYRRLMPRLPRGAPWRGTALRGDRPLAAVLNAHVGAVAKALDQVDPASAGALLETTIDLVALAFAGEMRDFAGDASTVRRALVARATQFIEGHLADPALSAESIARALGVSTGYLQHAFQGAGMTAGGHIRRRRLERCRDDLADRLRGGGQIGEIAMRWGFADMPHFSRAFKRQFGLSPRDYRARQGERTRRGR